jgi:hypothetical protein
MDAREAEMKWMVKGTTTRPSYIIIGRLIINFSSSCQLRPLLGVVDLCSNLLVRYFIRCLRVARQQADSQHRVHGMTYGYYV